MKKFFAKFGLFRVVIEVQCFCSLFRFNNNFAHIIKFFKNFCPIMFQFSTFIGFSGPEVTQDSCVVLWLFRKNLHLYLDFSVSRAILLCGRLTSVLFPFLVKI